VDSKNKAAKPDPVSRKERNMFVDAQSPAGESRLTNLGHAKVDQRSTHRIHTVCRFARVTSRSGEGLWRLRNISDRGIMFLSHQDVPTGERLSIALSEKFILDAETVWSDGERCGARFDTKVDSAALLCALALDQQLPGHRPLRLAVDRPALAFDGTGMHPVRIRSLSPYGVGLRHRDRLHAGAAVKLRFDDGVEHRGVVRWADPRQAGLRLLDPLAPVRLATGGQS
jgi:hypothetical protein